MMIYGESVVNYFVTEVCKKVLSVVNEFDKHIGYCLS